MRSPATSFFALQFVASQLATVISHLKLKDHHRGSMHAAHNALLPDPIVDIIAQDPSTPLAAHYRRFVRMELVPQILAISDILKAHSIIVTLPPKSWLMASFPQDAWYGKQCPLVKASISMVEACTHLSTVRFSHHVGAAADVRQHHMIGILHTN
eukprot:SAG31_NODE_670_length_12943_cov_18.029508_9_plen_155_part_00